MIEAFSTKVTREIVKRLSGVVDAHHQWEADDANTPHLVPIVSDFFFCALDPLADGGY